MENKKEFEIDEKKIRKKLKLIEEILFEFGDGKGLILCSDEGGMTHRAPIRLYNWKDKNKILKELIIGYDDDTKSYYVGISGKKSIHHGMYIRQERLNNIYYENKNFKEELLKSLEEGKKLLDEWNQKSMKLIKDNILHRKETIKIMEMRDKFLQEIDYRLYEYSREKKFEYMGLLGAGFRGFFWYDKNIPKVISIDIENKIIENFEIITKDLITYRIKKMGSIEQKIIMHQVIEDGDLITTQDDIEEIIKKLDNAYNEVKNWSEEYIIQNGR